MRDRYAQCDDTCTADCGACKGAGRPDDGRPRGVVLQLLALGEVEAAVRELPDVTDEHKVSFGYEPYAMREHDGRLYVVCQEGVGWEVTNDKPLRLPVYVTTPGFMALVPKHMVLLTPDEVRAMGAEGGVDLADLVRSFGTRLESNFWQWHGRFTGVFA